MMFNWFKKEHKPPLYYLATPYSHHTRRVRVWRYEMITYISAKLLADGIHNFSPITHSHELALRHDFPTSFDYWKEVDLNFLDRCEGLIVCKLNGWEKSIGVQGEIEYAEEHNIPIEYIDITRSSFTFRDKRYTLDD